jgi:hypothetical protein
MTDVSGGNDSLSIGSFALLTGLSIPKLRRYHQLGILVPADIDATTSYRRYERSQLGVARRRAKCARSVVKIGLETQFHDASSTIGVSAVHSVGSSTLWRRGWDLNPRTLSGHTISNRADSAALAPLLDTARRGYPLAAGPSFRAAVGSCATGCREPSQGRKAAALSGPPRVPQTAWPSHRATSPAGPGGHSRAPRPVPEPQNLT